MKRSKLSKFVAIGIILSLLLNSSINSNAISLDLKNINKSPYTKTIQTYSNNGTEVVNTVLNTKITQTAKWIDGYLKTMAEIDYEYEALNYEKDEAIDLTIVLNATGIEERINEIDDFLEMIFNINSSSRVSFIVTSEFDSTVIDYSSNKSNLINFLKEKQTDFSSENLGDFNETVNILENHIGENNSSNEKRIILYEDIYNINTNSIKVLNAMQYDYALSIVSNIKYFFITQQYDSLLSTSNNYMKDVFKPIYDDFDIHFNINENDWEIKSLVDYNNANGNKGTKIILELIDTSIEEGENFNVFHSSNPIIMINNKTYSLETTTLSRMAYTVNYSLNGAEGSVPESNICLEGTNYIVDNANISNIDGVFRGFRKSDEYSQIKSFNVVENTTLIPIFGEIDNDLNSSTIGKREVQMKHIRIDEIQTGLSVLVNKVEFIYDENKVPNVNQRTLDLSLDGSGSIIAWSEVINNETIIYISAFGNKIIANEDMSNFAYISSSRNYLTEIIGLEHLDTSVVTNMRNMFYNSKVTILNLNNWDTSNVTNMQSMFSSSKATTIDLSNWDTSNVTNMAGMFSFNQATTIDIDNLNTSNVTTMQNMFYGSKATILNVSDWDTSNVTNMSDMFHSSQATTIDLNNWDTSNVTNMSDMFRSSQATTIDLNNWDTSNVTNMSSMFQSSKATTIDLNNWNTSNVTTMSYMFSISKATTIDVSNWNTSNVTNMSYMFSNSKATTIDVSNWNTSNVTNMSSMFGSSQVTTIDVSNWNTSNVTNMSSMFGSSQATTIDVSNWNTSNVTNMSSMFRSSQATTIDVSNWNTSNVTTMSYMFDSSKATTIDLSNWNTSNVTNMSYMFDSSKATTIDVSNWDTSNINNMQWMFSSSQATTIDASNWNTSNVTNMSYMFSNSKATSIDLSNWDTSNVTTMQWMFQNCNIDTLDISSFKFSNNVISNSIFNSSNLDLIIVNTFEGDELYHNSYDFVREIARPEIEVIIAKEDVHLLRHEIEDIQTVFNIQTNKVEFLNDENKRPSENNSTPTGFSSESYYSEDLQSTHKINLINSSYEKSYNNKLMNLKNRLYLSKNIPSNEGLPSPNELIDLGVVNPLTKIDYTLDIQNPNNSISGVIEIENKLSPYVTFDKTTPIEVSSPYNVYTDDFGGHAFIDVEPYYDEDTHSIRATINDLSANTEIRISYDVITINPEEEFYDIEILNQYHTVENGLSTPSNFIKHTIKNTDTQKYNVSYSYTGDVPPFAPELPVNLEYSQNNEVVLLPKPQVSGYIFDGWYVDGVLTNDSFIMPNKNVNITGSFTKAEEAKHTVTYNVINPINNKTITLSSQEYVEGSILTVLDSDIAPIYSHYSANEFTNEQGTLNSLDEFEVNKDYVFTLDYDKTKYNITYSFENAPNDVTVPSNRLSEWGEEITIPTFNSSIKEVGAITVNGEVVNTNNFIMPKEDVNIVISFMSIKSNINITVTENPTNWTKSATLNILATSNNDMLSLITPDNEVIDINDTSYSYDYLVEENGLYEFKIVGQNGYVVSEEVNVTKIDNAPPIINATSVNGLISLELEDELSGIDYLELPNGDVVEDINNYTFKTFNNGSFLFIAYDRTGNKTIKSITVNDLNNNLISGIDYIEYKLSGAIIKPWTTYDKPFYITEQGITVLTARGYDNAGNISKEVVSIININSPHDDVVSGIDRVEYKLSGATTKDWTNYNEPFYITNEGITTITARAYDNAGNISIEKTTTVKLDKTSPINNSILIEINL